MKTKTEMKSELMGLVAKKIALTKERLAIKRKPFAERSSAEHQHMLGLWREGSTLKETIRNASLAYAFVRGRRRWDAERECGADNKPSYHAVAFWADAPDEEVKAWIETSPENEEWLAFTRKVEEAKAKARTAREERRKARAAA